MSELSWSTCNRCNTQAHVTLDHPDPSPDSLYQQPDPATAASRDVLPLVMADYEARMQYYAGPAQYGVPLRIDNLRDHLRDAYAEALDLPGYLKAAMVLWDEMRTTMREIGTLAKSQGSTDMLRTRLEMIASLAAPYQ